MTSPPSGVLAPEDAFTAVRPKEAVTGKEEKREARRLQKPRESSSWLASTDLPGEPAKGRRG